MTDFSFLWIYEKIYVLCVSMCTRGCTCHGEDIKVNFVESDLFFYLYEGSNTFPLLYCPNSLGVLLGPLHSYSCSEVVLKKDILICQRFSNCSKNVFHPSCILPTVCVCVFVWVWVCVRMPCVHTLFPQCWGQAETWSVTPHYVAQCFFRSHLPPRDSILLADFDSVLRLKDDCTWADTRMTSSSWYHPYSDLFLRAERVPLYKFIGVNWDFM